MRNRQTRIDALERCSKPHASTDVATANDALQWLIEQTRDSFPNLVQAIHDATDSEGRAVSVVDLVDAAGSDIRDEFRTRASRTYAGSRPTTQQTEAGT